jgi:hypothetical protein
MITINLIYSGQTSYLENTDSHQIWIVQKFCSKMGSIRLRKIKILVTRFLCYRKGIKVKVLTYFFVK